MKATFDQHIGVFEDAIPKELCERIINTFEEHIGDSYDRQTYENAVPIQKKDKSLGLLNNNPKLCGEFNQILFSSIYPLYENQYQLQELVKPPIPVFVSDYKVQKTPPTGGYHIWHIEHQPFTPAQNRCLVYTLYLNDVEEGGETEFLIQSKRVKPKQGTICLFPPYYTHIHRGNPPLSGEKYILTGWLDYFETKDTPIDE